MLLFGGNTYKGEPRQISEVYSWEKSITRRIISLPFDFRYGKCIYNNGIVYLCFDNYEKKLCRYRYICILSILEKNRIYSSDLVKFTSAETNVGHHLGGLEIFLSNPIAIGGRESYGGGTNEVEIFKNSKWEKKTRIGNSAEEVSYYLFSTMVLKDNINEFLFVFGKKI